LTAEKKLAAIVSSLRASGVSADLSKGEDGKLVLHEHTCPYSAVVAENPEACSAIHSLLAEVVPGEAAQVESLATGGHECRFEIKAETSERETATAP
jgi:predicted ArsR family transcriptional regulator